MGVKNQFMHYNFKVIHHILGISCENNFWL